MTTNEKINRLQTILSTMDVPSFRKGDIKGDIGWLIRNLGIRNAKNLDFKEANEILHDLNHTIDNS